MSNLKPSQRLLCRQIFKIRDKRLSLFNDAVHDLERIFQKAHTAKRARVKDSLAATVLIIRMCLFSAELPLIFAILVIAIMFSGSLYAPSLAHEASGIAVTMFTTFVGLIGSFFLLFLIYPLHLVYGAGLPLLVGVHCVMSAAIMSQFTYFYTIVLKLENVHSPSQIFFELCAIYAVTNFYLLFKYWDHLNFDAYKQRHKNDGFFDIIPIHIRAPLVSLTAQDHYVEIVTQKGSHLHRMSMKEAVGLTKDKQGVQVHRSHWVAFDAMHALEKSAERFLLKLRDGRQIPVAKSKLEHVQLFLESA